MAQLNRLTHSSDFLRVFDTLVTVEGTGAHPYVQSRKLVEGRDATRNLADVVHFLSLVHGRQPGMVDHAINLAVRDDARHWLDQAISAFARERAYLTQLGSATGPLPSTVGQQQCEQAAIAQGHAIDMLGKSERTGCALGAALAMALDWRAIRAVLDSAAVRLDVSARPAALPDLHETRDLIEAHSGTPGVERAMLFGAQQLLAQHRGLWDLLATRESVRSSALV
jgi:hypothetical protein